MCRYNVDAGNDSSLFDLEEQRITDVLYRAPGSRNWVKKDWDWALAEIAKRVKQTRDNTFERKNEYGVTVNRTQAIAHLGNTAINNEEAYTLHKLMRSLGVVRFNHHASSRYSSAATGLANAFGIGAMTNCVTDYRNADAFLIIGFDPVEDYPPLMRLVEMANVQRNAKMIVVDSDFTKTAAKADIYASIKSGSDIPFLYGVINYALENNLYSHDYVAKYTNASFLVNPDISFTDPGFLEMSENDDVLCHAPNGWRYQIDGDDIKKDLTLQDPNCIFQLLKKQVSCYDIATVSGMTGAPEDVLQKVGEVYCQTGKLDRAGSLIYDISIVQHDDAGQNVQAAVTLQLLLGNVGVSGGGLSVRDDKVNWHGFTDIGMFYSNNYPGYLNAVHEINHPTFQDYLKNETSKDGFWSNRPKLFISMLKAWYGDKATEENDFCYQYLPKHTGDEHSHAAIFQAALAGKVKGLFAWGEPSLVNELERETINKAMEKLDWMIAVNSFSNGPAFFWCRPEVSPDDIDTEVFLLPAALSYEKEGSVTNNSRWMQWSWKAVEPSGQAKSDLWIINRLMQAIRKEYRSDGKFPEPILDMTWDYDISDVEEPDVMKIAKEINGYFVADGSVLDTYTGLQGDGSTACGIWLFTGYIYTDASLNVPASQRRSREDKNKVGLFPKWSFSWPANQRIMGYR